MTPNTSLYILDRGHHAVQKVLLNGSNLTTILKYHTSYTIYDLYVDDQANIYLSAHGQHRILFYCSNSSNEIVVAGTGQSGSYLNRLNSPLGIFVDRNGTMYIADYGNHRIMKWFRGASSGIVVAEGKITGSNKQLKYPANVIVDTNKYLYISEYDKDRIIRWAPDSTYGTCIAACTGSSGTASNQLKQPRSLSFDSHDSLYVADRENHRVQKFRIVSTRSKYFTY